MTMHLFYTEDCDPSYQPVGFAESVIDNIAFPTGPFLEKGSTRVGTLDSGQHGQVFSCLAGKSLIPSTA